MHRCCSIASADLKPGFGFERRDHGFEHGELQHFGPGVWLIPYPEHEEMYGCILEGNSGHVVVLLDPADPAQRPRYDDVRNILTRYAVPADYMPLSARNVGIAASIADTIRRMRPPVTIIASETPWRDRLPRRGAEGAVALRDAYRPVEGGGGSPP